MTSICFHILVIYLLVIQHITLYFALIYFRSSELILQITAYQCYEKDKHITRHWSHEKREEDWVNFRVTVFFWKNLLGLLLGTGGK